MPRSWAAVGVARDLGEWIDDEPCSRLHLLDELQHLSGLRAVVVARQVAARVVEAHDQSAPDRIDGDIEVDGMSAIAFAPPERSPFHR
jgi:hypothetical protein